MENHRYLNPIDDNSVDIEPKKPLNTQLSELIGFIVKFLGLLLLFIFLMDQFGQFIIKNGLPVESILLIFLLPPLFIVWMSRSKPLKID